LSLLERWFLVTNISVIDDYHRSIIQHRPFAQVFAIGIAPVQDEVEEDVVADDGETKAKVVRRPKAAKPEGTEGVETK